MKRKITFSLTLILSLLLSLVSLPATAHPAPPRFKADTGVLTPSTGQTLRLTIAGDRGTDAIRVRLRWMQYAPQSCSGMPAVCHHVVVSQGVTPVETLSPDEALSFDVPGTGAGVRVVVEGNSPNVQARAIIFDTATQRIISMVIMANTEGD